MVWMSLTQNAGMGLGLHLIQLQQSLPVWPFVASLLLALSTSTKKQIWSDCGFLRLRSRLKPAFIMFAGLRFCATHGLVVAAGPYRRGIQVEMPKSLLTSHLRYHSLLLRAENNVLTPATLQVLGWELSPQLPGDVESTPTSGRHQGWSRGELGRVLHEGSCCSH